MSNEIADKVVVYEVNGENVKLSPSIIRDYLVSGNAEVSDQEVVMFLQLCKYQKLNPFLKEAYLVKFNGYPAQIITSKEAFMKRAETHEQYDGFEAGVIVERNGEIIELEGAVSLKDDKLLGGWARVFRKDRSRPVSVRISEKEFNKKQSTWTAMPLTMMRKTAVVNAMREAFPDNLGAMYTEEEQSITQSKDVNIQEEIAENANTEILDLPIQGTAQPETPEIEDLNDIDELEPQEEVNPPARPY
ncbi:TPA_asm: phage recombination protein Bet [Listeria innocua]|uniref:phage recombination protein Bet n=1 Tax=Listeria monocytogenes TaxID=1639 RepID=UPI0004DA389D|nr:phage recombination protein Bet [Listeria monocytogenes]HAC3176802.1 phage recombination protein Bet [Listeria innocua]EAA0148470.1 phage recombination protein Bet [Listeria monocytogenes]EAA0308327.1 phage recombination protein Bet [Listeria monocytogenes]EAA0314507.1 phage recombination protein Bet [Listeria monocytogenes]EAC3337423.1 phage recombination protein Bet [Listeria monocytogenes]